MEEAAVASREIFGGIGIPAYIMYFIALIVILVLARGIFEWVCLWMEGKHYGRLGSWWKRIWAFIVTGVVDGLIHKRIFGATRRSPREVYAGIMHFLIFWGCVILLLGAAIDFVTHYIVAGIFHIEVLVGTTYLIDSLIVDIGGLLALAGLIMAIVRRYIQKPDRLDNDADDVVVVSLLAAVVITGFFVEGFRISATELASHPEWSVWSIGGYVLAKLFEGASNTTLSAWHQVMWWFHSLLTLSAVVYVSISFSKFRHILVAPINVFFRPLGPVGALAPVNLEEAETFGAGKIHDFTWKQLMDLDACTRCGRCQDNCPAYLSQKPLSPKKMILDLKTDLIEEGISKQGILWFSSKSGNGASNPGKALVGDVVTEDELWACTTCRACSDICPVYIEHVDKNVEMRQNMVLEQARMPETAEGALKSLETRGHPWRGTTATRTTWMEGLDIKTVAEDNNMDILYWVGCTAALEDRSMRIAIAMSKILKAAGVNFRVLGEEEICCGDPARRMGNEYLFQMQAMQNIELLKGYGVKKIVTACPHGFNIMKNEYPDFGGEFEVIHHTEFIQQLLQEGRLKLTGDMPKIITYHDPCYLGRYNGIYEPPREVLRQIPGIELVEMEKRRERSFCCGGGGGHMWIEETIGNRINVMRTEHAIETGAEMIATTCPFCLQMFEDGIRTKEKEESLKVSDLAELIASIIEL